MSIWSSLEPRSATVDPGKSTTVALRVRNTGDLVEEYRIGVAGDPAVWARVEPATLRLYPGTTGTAEIVFAPPRTPDAAAGGHPFAVEVTPTEQPGAKEVVEGHLTITPFTVLRAELVPPVVRGRFGARPKVAVDNLGNTKVTASLSAKDPGGRLGVELHPANVQIEPGRAAWVDGRIKPGGITWFGQRESRPYTVHVLRSGREPVEVDGTFEQGAIMPRWLLGTGACVLAMAVAFTVAWFAFQPNFSSRARDGAMSPMGNPLALPSQPEQKASPSPPENPKAAPSKPAGQAEPKKKRKPRPLGGPGSMLFYLSGGGPWMNPPPPGEQAQTWSVPSGQSFPAVGKDWPKGGNPAIRTIYNLNEVQRPGSRPTFDFYVRSPSGATGVTVSAMFLWQFDGTEGALDRLDVFKPIRLRADGAWQKYTELAGLQYSAGSEYKPLKMGRLGVAFYVRSPGGQPVEVRTNVPPGDKYVSALRIPYVKQK